MKLNRRDLLKKIGIGMVAASLPAEAFVRETPSIKEETSLGVIEEDGTRFTPLHSYWTARDVVLTTTTHPSANSGLRIRSLASLGLTTSMVGLTVPLSVFQYEWVTFPKSAEVEGELPIDDDWPDDWPDDRPDNWDWDDE